MPRFAEEKSLVSSKLPVSYCNNIRLHVKVILKVSMEVIGVGEKQIQC